MKDFSKMALIGVVGYLIGFYECKNKVQSALLKALLNQGEDAQK